MVNLSSLTATQIARWVIFLESSGKPVAHACSLLALNFLLLWIRVVHDCRYGRLLRGEEKERFKMEICQLGMPGPMYSHQKNDS